MKTIAKIILFTVVFCLWLLTILILPNPYWVPIYIVGLGWLLYKGVKFLD